MQENYSKYAVKFVLFIYRRCPYSVDVLQMHLSRHTCSSQAAAAVAAHDDNAIVLGANSGPTILGFAASSSAPEEKVNPTPGVPP